MAEFVGPFNESLESVRTRMFATLAALYPDPESRPDIRQPAPMWDFLSIASAEFSIVYLELNEVLKNAFIQYADEPYLDDLAAQNGVDRLDATGASGTIRFLGTIGALIPIGTSVSTEPTSVDDPVYTYDTTVAGTVAGLADPATAPTLHSDEAWVETVTEGVAATTNEVQRVSRTAGSTGTFTLTHSGQTTAGIAYNATAAQVRDALVALSNIGGVNEVQNVTVDATAGTFTVTYVGQTTAALAFNVSAADFTTAMIALSNLDAGDVVVTGGPGNSGGTTPYVLTFGGSLAYTNVAQVTCTDVSLSGGGDTVTPTTVTSGVVPDVAVTGSGPWDVEFINALAQTDVAQMTAGSGALTPAAGPISGDLVYKYAYVTNLNTSSSDYGYTLPSPASLSLEGISSASVDVTIPAISWDPAVDLTDIMEVLVYRSYKSLSDTDFSEYKYVGSLLTSPEAGGTFTDSVTDSAFLLIDEGINARGGVAGVNTTGVVEVAALSQDEGAATSAAVGTVVNIDDDIVGVEVATNPEAFSGGTDEETVEALRARTLEDVRAVSGAGNVAAYIKWAKSQDGIYAASVTPEFDGPGTVRVVLAGPSNTEITNPATVETVRQYIAGTVAIDDPATNPITSGTANSGGLMLPGTYNYAYTFVNEGGGETLPSPTVAQVVPAGTNLNTVTLSNIPLGPSDAVGPELCTSRKIYRSLNSDPVVRLELVTEIEDNLTSSYIDDTPQTTLPAPRVPSLDDTLTPHYAPRSNSTSLYDGVAPIGHHLTVETVVPIGVAVNATIVPETGYTLAGSGTTVNLTDLLTTSLADYFENLVPGERIKYKDVENAIHDTVGVEDFGSVEILVDPYITPVTTNLTIDGDQAMEYSPGSAIFTEAESL